MTSLQQNLFTPNAYGGCDPPLARAGDPLPSHPAAQKVSGHANTQGEIILAILRRAGTPLTYREVYKIASDNEKRALGEANTVCKRLTTLSRRQLVRALEPRVCSVGGSEARPWELVN
jgi:predicted Zn-ribbon and HTH transcriptional regulator